MQALQIMNIIHQICVFQLIHVILQASSTPLDDYVNKPDDSYVFEVKKTVKVNGLTQYFVNMTSQTWLNSALVSQSKWYHDLIINVPDLPEREDYALLFIGGGDNAYHLPGEKDADVRNGLMLALTTGLITATLKQIPNQPIKFSEDPDRKDRKEGALVAYTFRHFVLNTSEPEYLAYLPMTKAVVRALDTITQILQKEKGLSVGSFGVAGGSKRGWTTWTAAMVDKRIIAIAPIVLDLVNLGPILHHMYRSFDGWSFAFADYLEANVTESIDSPEFDLLLEIVDPFRYFDRLERSNISIMLINTCGDEFMMPDDNLFFWDKLPAPKYMKMLPNAEHSTIGHIIGTIMDLGSFFLAVINDYKLPQTNWEFKNDNDLVRLIFTTDTKPIDVVLWYTNTLPKNPKRDFRLLAGPDPKNPTPQLILWKKKDVKDFGNLTYLGEINAPEVGWSGCFIEASYEFQVNGKTRVFQITTQVNIFPPNYPYPDCHGKGCKGKLV